MDHGVGKRRIGRGALLAGLAALCLGIGSAHGGAFPAAPGLIVFASGGSIYSVPSAGGAPSAALAGGSDPAVSPDGTTIAYDRLGQIYTIPIGGGTEVLVSGALGSEPAWSPDGSTIYYTSGPTPPDATSEIMSIPAAGGTSSQLTTNSATDQDPSVSPSGKVAYASNLTGTFEIWTMNADGTGQTQVSGGAAGTTNTDPSWSPDGTNIAFISDRSGTREVWQTTPGGAGGDTPITSAGVALATPAYSPDGSLIAVAFASGIGTVPSSGGSSPPTLVAGTAGGTAPDWQDAAPVNSVAPTLSPTGAPTIGETLTGTQGTWLSDPTTTSYAYEWIRCDGLGQNCIVIPFATNTTYTTTAADVGSSVTLKFRTIATNNIGSTFADSSLAGHFPDWPVNLTTPNLTPVVPHAFPFGTVISVTTGTWSGLFPISYTFQWQWCDYATPPVCEDIPGAISSSYAPSGDYIGHQLRARITAKNSAGSDFVYSTLTWPVQGDLPLNTVSPAILAGSIEVGSTLTSGTGTFSGSTPLRYTYQWQRCQPSGWPCTPIAGATSSSYVLQPADQGWTIRSFVTATNGGGAYTGQSNHTLPILPKTRFGPSNTDPPTLSGKTVVGSTLVADSGDWSGEAPIRYTYTWLHCDATGQDCNAIPNVSGTTYKLKISDVGYTVKLLVTGRNALAASTVNSDPSNVIVQLPPQPKGRKLNGTKKNDYLAGGGGNDTIHGSAGNDTIMGGGGDDYLYGDDGNDVIDGGPGADHIYGGKGSDTIFAADGQRDWIDCGPGVDKATVDAIDVVKNCESISTPLSGNVQRRPR